MPGRRKPTLRAAQRACGWLPDQGLLRHPDPDRAVVEAAVTAHPSVVEALHVTGARDHRLRGNGDGTAAAEPSTVP